MDTDDDDEYGACHWATVLMDNGDGPISPHVLTQAQLREFVWWVLDPAHYVEFRRMMRFRNRVQRHLKHLKS